MRIVYLFGSSSSGSSFCTIVGGKGKDKGERKVNMIIKWCIYGMSGCIWYGYDVDMVWIWCKYGIDMM